MNDFTYHTLLPYYVQDALRDAADTSPGMAPGASLARIIAINAVVATAARRYPEKFTDAAPVKRKGRT